MLEEQLRGVKEDSIRQLGRCFTECAVPSERWGEYMQQYKRFTGKISSRRDPSYIPEDGGWPVLLFAAILVRLRDRSEAFDTIPLLYYLEDALFKGGLVGAARADVVIVPLVPIVKGILIKNVAVMTDRLLGVHRVRGFEDVRATHLQLALVISFVLEKTTGFGSYDFAGGFVEIDLGPSSKYGHGLSFTVCKIINENRFEVQCFDSEEKKAYYLSDDDVPLVSALPNMVLKNVYAIFLKRKETEAGAQG